MRRVLVAAVSIMAFTMTGLWPAGSSTPSTTLELMSADSILRWINGYRQKPDPAGVPDVVKALSRMGTFKDPEAAGAYVGFIAGVIAANPARAEELIAKMLPLPEETQWVIVRAIAYSDHPEWRRLLEVFAPKMPTRGVMIDRFLTGQSPRLFQVAPEKPQSLYQKARDYYETHYGDKTTAPPAALEPSPELLDTFWGYYFATGRYRPVARIVAMLPWSLDNNSVELLTLGNMAKYTLASNAVRDSNLLGMLKHTAERQPKQTARVLREVIEAAETVETAQLRKAAMASIEELRRKGPASRREVSKWGNIGVGALSLGCIGAAAVGAIALGLPCVVGGAMSQAGLRYWESQQ